MKIVIEKEEWQLLGQLALEAADGLYKGSGLAAAILWEFSVEHADAFKQPQRRKRKLRFSTVLGLYSCLKLQQPRDEPLWDITLMELTDKLFKAIKT